MSVIYIVLPLALVLGGGALAAFWWAVQRGQFEDLDTPAIRVALEDDAGQPLVSGRDPQRPRRDSAEP